jgi:hypothetical protein
LADKVCITVGPPKEIGFFRRVDHDDGSILLAFDFTVDPDSTHYRDLLILNDGWFWHNPVDQAQVYFIPANETNKKEMNIELGYLLAKDTVEKCPYYHHIKLSLSPSNKSVQ